MSGFAKSGVIDGQVAAMDVYTECYILKAGYSAPCFDGMIADGQVHIALPTEWNVLMASTINVFRTDHGASLARRDTAR
ncbi:MAG: hypothetical protein RKO68_01255 [Candidatus Accumulibacter sp.]|nr:hypothetical protein [Accumulibacter sp.]